METTIKEAIEEGLIPSFMQE